MRFLRNIQISAQKLRQVKNFRIFFYGSFSVNNSRNLCKVYSLGKEIQVNNELYIFLNLKQTNANVFEKLVDSLDPYDVLRL